MLLLFFKGLEGPLKVTAHQTPEATLSIQVPVQVAPGCSVLKKHDGCSCEIVVI